MRRTRGELGGSFTIRLKESSRFRLSRLDRLTDIALAQPAQQCVGIDAGVVAVAPLELQRVPADRFNILEHDQQRNIIRLDPKLARPLIGAGRAGTPLPEIADRIDALVPISPLDPEHPLVDPLHILGFKNCCAHRSISFVFHQVTNHPAGQGAYSQQRTISQRWAASQ